MLDRSGLSQNFLVGIGAVSDILTLPPGILSLKKSMYFRERSGIGTSTGWFGVHHRCLSVTGPLSQGIF